MRTHPNAKDKRTCEEACRVQLPHPILSKSENKQSLWHGGLESVKLEGLASAGSFCLERGSSFDAETSRFRSDIRLTTSQRWRCLQLCPDSTHSQQCGGP